MENVIKVLCDIRDTKGAKDKAKILEHNKNDDLFKKVIRFILSNDNTGIDTKKIKKKVNSDNVQRCIFDVEDLMCYLENNNTGRDVDLKQVKLFIDEQPDEHKEFYYSFVTKKFKMGVTAKSVNKIYGKDFLPQIEVMLAKKYEDEFSKIQNCEFFITEKYDGMRCLCIKNEEGINFYTRQGIKILGLVDIEKSISKLPDGFYDGELLIQGHEQLKDREVLQQTLKITRKDGEKHGVDFYIFDYITLQEFEDGKSKSTYKERREFLEQLTYIDVPNSMGENLVLAPILYKGSDHNEIPPLLKEMEDKGREGLMLNTNSIYECKRTHNILKLKTMQTADLKVIGFEKGKSLGKYAETLGNLVVDYKGYPLGVGSGFSEEERHFIWENQDKLLGKIVQIQYFRESKNDNGGLSVSFPVYQGVRHDKSEPSYY